MVFRPPARETVELLRAILQKFGDTPDNESGDLAYLRRLMLERIAELEAVQKVDSSETGTRATHRKAA
jgi:hypothetical protein